MSARTHASSVRGVARASFAFAAALLALLPRPARAGGNSGASAYLTWNATDKTVTDTAPAATNNLYVYVERATALSFKGGEIDLTWNPSGDGNGCFDHIGTTFKTSSGTTCTYLNRGSAVPVTTFDDPNHLHVAWANNSSLTSCTRGAIIQVQFETDGCADARGCITMNTCLLLDGANQIDVASVAGPNATVGGGTGFCGGVTNHPPTIQPIADQTVNVHATLSVTAVASDPDGDPLTFSATGLPAGASLDASTGVLLYTPATGAQGTYPGVTVTVSDGHGGNASASFTITVPNRAPVVAAIPNQQVTAGILLTVTPSGSDADTDVLTWSGLNLPGGATVAPGNGVLSWTPSTGQVGSFPGVGLQAVDPFGAGGSASFTIDVMTPANNPPVVQPISDQTVDENAALTVTPSGSDPDNDPLTWSGANLPAGATVDPATGVLSWTPSYTQAGSYPGVLIEARDTAGGVGSASFAITVTDVDRAPTVDPIADRTVMAGSLLSVQPTGSDPDGDALTWSGSNLPSGSSVAASGGLFTWTPTSGQVGTYPGVTLTAADPTGASGSAAFAITVSPGGPNDGAQAWLTWSPSSVVSDLAAPAATSNLYIRVVGAGSFKGAEFDLTWAPSGDGNGCYDHISTQFRTSTDCTYLNRGIAVPIVVADTPDHFHVAWANNTPNLSCASGGNAIVMGFEFDGCASVPAGCFTLGSMILLDADNLQSTPQIAGPQASILGGTPFCGGPNHPPTVDPIADQTAMTGSLFTLTATAHDPDGETITWSGSNFPAGATINPATGVISWTPGPDQIGTYPNVTVTVTDPHGATGSASFTITVTPGDARTFYVDGTSPCSTCDGTSWPTAFHTVTEGITAMSSSTTADTLRVAEGIYREPTPQPPARKVLIGSYPHGGGERDLMLHRTVLGAYSAAVPVIGLLGDGIVLDGFTLTGGRNSINYGTVMVRGANIVMRSLWITNNVNRANPLVFIRGAGSTGVVMDRCIISQNVIGQNGCVEVDAGASLTMTDCDVVADSSYTTQGCSFLAANGTATVINTIVWQITPASVPLIFQPQNVTVSYSDLAQFDPLFCSISGRQFTLQPGSPCIGAGQNGTTMGALDVVGCGASAPLAMAAFRGPEGDAGPAAAPLVTGLLSVGPTVGTGGAAIAFGLADEARARLEVFDAGGRKIATLADRTFGRGTQSVRWTATRDDGAPVPAGVYVIRFASGAVTQNRRVVVVR